MSWSGLRRLQPWRLSVLETTSMLPPAQQLSGNCPAGAPDPARKRRPAAGGAADCGRRHRRRSFRWRRPPANGRPASPARRLASTDHGAPVGRTAGGRRSSLGPSVVRSSRQTVAALLASGFEDGAASAGGHPVAEAVVLGPPSGVRLKSSLHEQLLASGGAGAYALVSPVPRQGRPERAPDHNRGALEAGVVVRWRESVLVTGHFEVPTRRPPTTVLPSTKKNWPVSRRVDNQTRRRGQASPAATAR